MGLPPPPLPRVNRSWFMICDSRISIRSVCCCISRFVICDRNYHWRQRKMQLCSPEFACLILKSAEIHEPQNWILRTSWHSLSRRPIVMISISYPARTCYSTWRIKYHWNGRCKLGEHLQYQLILHETAEMTSAFWLKFVFQSRSIDRNTLNVDCSLNFKRSNEYSAKLYRNKRKRGNWNL